MAKKRDGELRTMRKSVARLRAAPYNPRDISPKALEGLRTSIREFGLVEPIIWNKRTRRVVAGHQRVEALKQEGVKSTDVIVVDLPEEREKVLNVALNNPHIMGHWTGGLAGVLDDIEGTLPDLMDGLLLGDLRDDLPPLDEELWDGLTDPDNIPEPPDKAITQAGDMWKLGDHRLLCGDAGEAADVDRLVAGMPVHLVNTDPPYNVHVEPRSNTAIAAGVTSVSRRADLQCERSTTARGKRDRAMIHKRMHHQNFDVARGAAHPKRARVKMRAKDRAMEGDFMPDKDFVRVLRLWFGNLARVLDAGRAFYIWGGYANCANYPAALEGAGLYFSQAIIWVKEHPVLTRKDFMGNHEWCFYGWKKGAAHYFNPEITNATDVWAVKKISPQSMIHLTEKPVELAVRAMTYSSRPKENVLDLFGGSGSTLIAAERISDVALSSWRSTTCIVM